MASDLLHRWQAAGVLPGSLPPRLGELWAPSCPAGAGQLVHNRQGEVQHQGGPPCPRGPASAQLTSSRHSQQAGQGRETHHVLGVQLEHSHILILVVPHHLGGLALAARQRDLRGSGRRVLEVRFNGLRVSRGLGSRVQVGGALRVGAQASGRVGRPGPGRCRTLGGRWVKGGQQYGFPL